MPIELKMPALSPTMEEGTLAKWLVKEGDEVTSGTILAEIETDKATMEFEAIDEGKIAQILVPEGTDEVKVGTVIAILAQDGEDVSAAAAAPAKESKLPVEQLSDQKTEAVPQAPDEAGQDLTRPPDAAPPICNGETCHHAHRPARWTPRACTSSPPRG